jgi:hypothetical protein
MYGQSVCCPGLPRGLCSPTNSLRASTPVVPGSATRQGDALPGRSLHSRLPRMAGDDGCTASPSAVPGSRGIPAPARGLSNTRSPASSVAVWCGSQPDPASTGSLGPRAEQTPRRASRAAMRPGSLALGPGIVKRAAEATPSHPGSGAGTRIPVDRVTLKPRGISTSPTSQADPRTGLPHAHRGARRAGECKSSSHSPQRAGARRTADAKG